MAIRAARFPNHEHSHKHTGIRDMPVKTAEPKYTRKTKDKGSDTVFSSNLYWSERQATVDFSKMSTSSAGVSKIRGAGIDLTNNANDLYSPHMRVYFIFKCT